MSNERDKRDAARFRWMIKNADKIRFYMRRSVMLTVRTTRYFDTLRRAVDAAMADEKQEREMK